MILGLVVILLLWMFLFGFSVPLRWLLVRLHRARHQVVLESWLKYPARKIRVKRLVMLFIWTRLILVVGHNSPFAFGVTIGALICLILWPFYVRSKTCTMTLLVFDRQGMTVFPARRGILGSGTFSTRLNWIDCFGYSYYKGHLLFSLRSGGQIEQETGNRLIIGQTLQRLGLRKLRMYDILEREPQRPERNQEALYQAEFDQLLQQVETMAQDIVDSYQGDAAEMGFYLHAELREGDDSEEENEPYRYLHLSLREGEEEVDELDWMIWAKSEQHYEVLHLPEERLYEALDERVLSLLEAQQRERGQRTSPRVVLQ